MEHHYSHDLHSSSDCESTVSSSSSSSSPPRRSTSLTVNISESEGVHGLIRRRFLSCLQNKSVSVVGISRKSWLGFSDQARLQSFQIHSQAVAKKNGGLANVKFAWYGDRKDRIDQILSNGFGYTEVQGNVNGAVFLSPDDSPSQSLDRALPDADGIRHMLLCRVLLGRSELIPPGSSQTHPSSDEFDSGVDGVERGKKYIIWSTHMNTHIIPEFVVSFRGNSTTENNARKVPKSPWISFPALIPILGKFLAQDAVELITKYYTELKEKKITRTELIGRVRQVAGDKLLGAIIKSYNNRRGATRGRR